MLFARLAADRRSIHPHGPVADRARDLDTDLFEPPVRFGALGLVVNVLVLWTTLYMDRALAQLRSHGAVVNDDDVARLSPLGTNRINVLGRYHFSLPEAIARGDFRPLRDPAEFDDEDALIYAAATEDL